MAIFSVSSPNYYQIKMAYNAIIITVLTTGTNPIVYVDIYMTGSYYKTISSTTPTTTGFFGFSVWQIDIRDAAQEYLRATAQFVATFPTSPQNINDGIATCTVKVRGSSISGGFVVPDSPIPVQGTMDNAPVSGGGITAFGAPSWLIFNGVTQLEEDQVPDNGLAANNRAFVKAGYTIYNLFRNPRLTASVDTFMRLPIFIPKNGLLNGTVATENLWVIIEDQGGNFYYFTTPGPSYATYATFAEVNVYYIPAGPKNFAGLGVAFGVTPDWTTITRYRVRLEANSFPLPGSTRWYSPWITVAKPCPDTKRFIFANWYGHFEPVTFCEHQEEYIVTGQGWEQFNLGNNESFGKGRYNVRSNELITAVGYFQEREMFFLKQFLSNPKCYLQTTGAFGQPDYHRPVRLVDVTCLTRKMDERYIYEVTVQAQPANERTNIRN
jgi:hypothetical protein